MRILTVVTSDGMGGAGKAAFRLHSALCKSGMDGQMLVKNKVNTDSSVLSPTTKIQKIRAYTSGFVDVSPLVFYSKKTVGLFSPSIAFSGLNVDIINRFNADIVHLHWVNNGLLKIEDIVKINAPVVWSMHDMWPFTGGCHYNNGCKRYLEKCGKCPAIGSSFSYDLSRYIFSRKRKAFAKKNISVIGLSRWISEKAKESSLFSSNNVYQLPNPIDCDLYSPVGKEIAKSILGISQNKKLILFGAMNGTKDPRKGFEKLTESLSRLSPDNYELAVFGGSTENLQLYSKYKIYSFGKLFDDYSLRLLYSSADVFVVPSLQENLSNAIMESLACGTPVVCFDIGGNSDMVDHKINGYLSDINIEKSLADGIEWVAQEADSERLRDMAVLKVRNNFDSDKVAKSYIKLYERIINV